MLLSPNRKKVAALIVAGRKHPDYVQKLGEESGTGDFIAPDEEDDGNMGLESAMEELISALNDKNARRAAEAFRSAIELCDAGEDSEEELGD